MLRLLVSMFGRRPLVLALLAGYLAYVFTLLGRHLVGGRHQPAAHADRPGLRAARARGLPAHPTDPLLVVALRLDRLAGWSSTRRPCCSSASTRSSRFAWFTTGGTPIGSGISGTRYRAGVLAYGALGVGYLALYVQYGLDFSPGDATPSRGARSPKPRRRPRCCPAWSAGRCTWQPLSVGAFADRTQAGGAGLVGRVRRRLLVYAQPHPDQQPPGLVPAGLHRGCNVVCSPRPRANVVGPDIAREYRYQTESGALFVIGVGLAFLPLVGAARSTPASGAGAPELRETRGWCCRAGRGRRGARPLVSSTATSTSGRTATATEAYFANVASASPSAGHARCRWSTSASRRPCCGPTATRRTPTATCSATFADRTSYPRASVDRLYIFDDQGSASPRSTSRPTRTQLGANGCGYPLAGRRTTIPLDGPVIGGGWWIRSRYGSLQDVDTHSHGGRGGLRPDLPKGLHNLFVQAAGDFDSVTSSDYPSGTGSV